MASSAPLDSKPGNNDAEVFKEATLRNFRIVRSEGARQVAREVKHHNLDAIISVNVQVSAQPPFLWPSFAPAVTRTIVSRSLLRIWQPILYEQRSCGDGIPAMS